MRRFRLPMGHLLLLLGAGVLCYSGTTQAYAGQQSKTLSAVKIGSAVQQVALVARKGKAAPPPPLKTQIGDLTISGQTKMEQSFTTGALHLIGTETEIEVPDKTGKSILYVHADDIQASRVGKTEFGLITLDHNVRYRLVQQADSGERILEGTAGHAEVRRTAKRMDFTGGVRTKLTDAARFSGPANLRTGSLTVKTDTPSYRFNLEGAAANNDLRFTPLQAAPPKADGKPAPLAPVGAVHIYGFRSGDLQFGEAIHLEGADTTCEFVSPDTKTAWRLQGEQFEGVFVPKTSDLQRATVTDNIKFHLTQPAADKKAQTVVDGTASRASYVRTKTEQETVMHGPLNVQFFDPQRLEEPGLLTAEASATLNLKKSGESLSYSLDDPNHSAKIHFIPKSIDADEAKPKAPPVPK
jgi:hypothetical protein